MANHPSEPTDPIALRTPVRKRRAHPSELGYLEPRAKKTLTLPTGGDGSNRSPGSMGSGQNAHITADADPAPPLSPTASETIDLRERLSVSVSPRNRLSKSRRAVFDKLAEVVSWVEERDREKRKALKERAQRSADDRFAAIVARKEALEHARATAEQCKIARAGEDAAEQKLRDSEREVHQLKWDMQEFTKKYEALEKELEQCEAAKDREVNLSRAMEIRGDFLFKMLADERRWIDSLKAVLIEQGIELPAYPEGRSSFTDM
ncbi:hypothetical protein JR316_0004414 [Psilocybe cubensis]|uniref:Uncharacterized protein n=2 Tax=Psilocybe cubensis TaxID=181762 RepID=A0A8H7Y0R1_PSICU|nr:hypothetical protein JR316_0004414 [Psilocybe cubensis]KAH9482316.1 hypothetical protein JR316_0004414 [Psilocybe cubensis]